MANELQVPENIKALLAEQSAAELDKERSTNDIVFLSSRGKKWRVDDETLPAELHVVVGVATYEKTYYDRDYDPGASFPPACFAAATSIEDLVPHDTSPDPQHTVCSECPLNKFETARIGKGKACKDHRKMILVNWTEEKGLETGQLAQYRLSPASLKNWGSYVKAVGLKLNVPTSAVVTTMTIDEEPDFPVVKFALHSVLRSEEDIRTIMELKPKMEEAALRPYNVEDYAPPPKAASAEKKSKMS
jgi:hypothetical protein